MCPKIHFMPNVRLVLIALVSVTCSFGMKAQNGSAKSAGLPKSFVVGYAFIDDNGSGSPTGLDLPGLTLLPNTVGIFFPVAPVGTKGAFAGVNVTLSGGSVKSGTGRIVVADVAGEYATSEFEIFGTTCSATARAGLALSTRNYLVSPTSNLAVVGAGLNMWLAPERMALNFQGVARYDLEDQDDFGQLSIGVLYRF
jgi:hypothetical protein